MPSKINKLTLFLFILAMSLGSFYFWIKHQSFSKNNRDKTQKNSLPAPQIPQDSLVTDNPIQLKNDSIPTPEDWPQKDQRPGPSFAATDLQHSPPTHQIEVQIDDGWAIAYGDQLVGKVEKGTRAKKGLVETPKLFLWEKNEIPFAISKDLINPERVLKVIEYFNQKTSIKFVPFEGQADALVFETGPQNCYSYLGKIGGLQPIRLSPQCRMTEIMHEIMHALGFIHEHSRTDRDQFIEILWEKIDPKYQNQFEMVPDTFMEPLHGSQFDYRSVMIYPKNSFAKKSDLLTLRSKSLEEITPSHDSLSDEDLRRLARVYPSLSQ